MMKKKKTQPTNKSGNRFHFSVIKFSLALQTVFIIPSSSA